MIEFATTWGRADLTGDVTAGLQVGAPSSSLKRWQKSNWQQTASTSRLGGYVLRVRSPKVVKGRQ